MNLPESYHPHDKLWITEQLKQLSIAQRKRAIDGYTKVHKEALSNATSEIKAECEARREANTRLRKFVENIKKSKNPRKPRQYKR